MLDILCVVEREHIARAVLNMYFIVKITSNVRSEGLLCNLFPIGGI